MERTIPSIHGDDHTPGGPDPIRYAGYHVIVRRHDQVVIVQSPAAVFSVSRSTRLYRLFDVEAAVVTAGADTEIAIYNNTQGVDMLSTSCFVDAGDLHSKDAGTQPVVKTNGDELVQHGDQLWIEVLDAGGGTKGLDVVLVFT